MPKEKTFKPQLAPNEEIDLALLNYPFLASLKIDGIRCIFKDGEILSRSLKPIQNKQLKEKFEHIRFYAKEHGVILDGEIYSPGLTFQDITSFVMTQDFEDPKSVKKYGKVVEIPEHLNFYCFDCLTVHNRPFHGRIADVHFHASRVKYMIPVGHVIVGNKDDVNGLFEEALERGCEGLILRNPNSLYKYGRGTVKEGSIFKVKPYETFDAKITGVVQSTVVDPNAEKKVNELGRSVTSKKKDDRVLIEKASAFWVDYEDHELKVVLAMSDEEKEEVWKNRDSYIGRYIEYKGMKIGAKDVPRHPVMTRFREDKDV